MANLAKNLTRIVVLVVVVAIVVVGAIFLFSGPANKKVTAQFPAAVGIYTGTPVKVLGVEVGEVTSVKPRGAYVEVGMEYEDKYTLPKDATAVEVANSLVSDRFIQLTAYTGSGPKMANDAMIPLERTSAPAELDDIYKALNSLSLALGPNGANKKGALSTLIKVGAANLKGNGAAIGTSIEKLSQAARTLSDGRKDLFGTVTNLRRFTNALSDSDGEVRKFNQQLAQVAGDLAGERQDLGAALKQLGIALDKVNGFVKKNAAKFHSSISGLREITGVLVKQKASLDETLAVGPVALANLVHSYQPRLGVIASRGNLSSLTDPGQLCGLLASVPNLLPDILSGLSDVLGPLSKTIATTCTDLLNKNPDILKNLLKNIPNLTEVGTALGGLLGGGLGKVIVGGAP